MPASATLAHQKTPCSRVRAPRVAARPGRGGASGASFMPDSKTTDDRYAMRPIDVELYETCAKGTLAQVKALLDRGADPNAVHWSVYKQTDGTSDGDDYYCIHEAARNPDTRVFDLLVEHGANPCQKDFWGAEPLSYAAHNNTLEMVKHLVELGNDPNLCDMDGQTVIGNAALNPDIRVVEFLLSTGAKLDHGALDASELGRALRKGTTERVRFFLEHGSRLDGDIPYFARLAPLRNLRVLLDAGFDPNTPDSGNNKDVRIVDGLDGKRRELFLQRGAHPFFPERNLCFHPYDCCLPLSSGDVIRHANSFAPYLSVSKGKWRNRVLTGSLKANLDIDVRILVETMKERGLRRAKSIHFLVCDPRQPCRKDFCRVTPFFKPKKGFLWHASLDYGEARVPLDFVVANAFQGDAFDLCSKGGVFQMRFMGLGESIACMNRKGIVRFWDGLPVARERRDKGDPSVDHVDMVFSEARSLNPCHDKENPAFAEFISTIENVSMETICGQPCYRIRLWSGPLKDPASFPWTLLIAKSRVPKGWIPRVGDFVNGVAAMYGTFDDKAEEGVEPTVFQPEFLSADSVPEPPIPKKDIPKTPKGKPETEWLPRQPKEYPAAPAPRVPLPAFTDEPFKKFVTYPEYRQHLGKDLVPVPPPSRKRLREIIDAIDHIITTDGDRRVFAPHFDAIGVRHAVRDPATGETHLWLELPPVYLRWDHRAALLVAVGSDGQPLRYAIHTGDESGNWAHGEMYCNVTELGGKYFTGLKSPSEVLSQIPALVKDDFFILCAVSRGSMFQAKCRAGGKRKRYVAEWQLFGMEWQFSKDNVSEKRLLELCHLFLSGGLAAVENEEPWKQVKMKGTY